MFLGNTGFDIRGYRCFCSCIHSLWGTFPVVPWILPFPRRFSHSMDSFCNRLIDLYKRPLRKLYLMYLITFSTLPLDSGSALRQNIGSKGLLAKKLRNPVVSRTSPKFSS